jgi:putative transposase
LKHFLIDDEGRTYDSPQFYKTTLGKTRRLHRELSRKVEGSNAYKQAQRALAKHSADVANARRDHHFKLVYTLCDALDVLYFEDLNLRGMKALWGRKVSDLGFASFLSILGWVAFKRGKTVVKLDRFTPTTQVCSVCGRKHALTLRDRTLHCACGLVIDRDLNAAINIQRIGASPTGFAPVGSAAIVTTPSDIRYRSDRKTKLRLRSRVDGRRPCFSCGEYATSVAQ